MDTFINTMQLLCLWIPEMHRNINDTGIFTKFGNVYEQLSNTHTSVLEHTYLYDKALMSFAVTYKQLSCIVIKSAVSISHLKGVNKY